MHKLITALVAIVAAAIVAPAAIASPGVEIMTTRHGVFISADMPHCTYEDGSGGPLPCTWNLGAGQDGNGIGLAYWVGTRGHAHYLWSSSPIAGHARRGWVTRTMSHDFARHADGRHHRPAWWRRCFVHYGSSSVVHCANGSSYSTS